MWNRARLCENMKLLIRPVLSKVLPYFPQVRKMLTVNPPKLEGNYLHSFKIPSIIVFDLDRTLWPFKVDKDISNPFKLCNNNVVDATGKIISLFPGAFQLLEYLVSQNYVLGVASRIEDVMGAYQLLQLFQLNEFFTYKEIYPTSKVLHFRELQRKSGFRFQDMVFFDDDERNIRSVGRLGVVTFLVPEGGVTNNFVLKSLELFSKNNL